MTARPTSPPSLGYARARWLGRVVKAAREAATVLHVQALAADHDATEDRSWRTVAALPSQRAADEYVQTFRGLHGKAEHEVRVRQTVGLSQGDLADLLGVSQSSVSLWEAGKSNPDIGRFGEVFKVLGLTAGAVWDDMERIPEDLDPEELDTFLGLVDA